MAIEAAETRRVEDLFRYLKCTSNSAGLSQSDNESDEEFAPASGRISDDPVLNGLCQLGAQHLRCDRAFVSLIDHEQQFIIAEMTKSMSLYDSSRHDDGDDICLGARPFDLEAGVCGSTMLAFTEGQSGNRSHRNDSNGFSDHTRYVINDFTKEEKYQDRPYVTGAPYFRSYFEVPIRSSQGFVIGTYAVIHSEPRQGLDEKNYLILADIADSIMRHIELVKMQDDYLKLRRLFMGLNSLIQHGQADPVPQSQDGENTAIGPSPRAKHVVPESIGPLSPDKPLKTQERSIQPNGLGTTQLTSLPEGEPSHNDNLPIRPVNRTLQAQHGLSRKISKRRARQAKALEEIEASESEQSSDVSSRGRRNSDTLKAHDVRQNFNLAAALLRSAMDLDTIMFLDPPKDSSSTNGTADKAVEPESKVLGLSEKPTTKNKLPSQDFSITESLHRKLIANCPHGQIFNVGELKRKCDNQMQAPVLKSTELKLSKPQQIPIQAELKAEITLLIPDARSVVYLPLWNVAKQSWFAGCLGWSSRDRRVMQNQDLVFSRVFGNSFIAKTTRLELAATSQAQADFISSISHELRSPLHGIMGSTELLRESVKDHDQQQLINMVEQCGRTLLDTMNHVLVFSKINSSIQDEVQDSENPMREAPNDGSSLFDMSLLVEESVASLVAGYQYSSRSSSNETPTLRSLASNGSSEQQTDDSQIPLVILNIDRTANWLVESDAPSWRRCILNVLGNALKYTKTGFVEVSVRSRPRTASSVTLDKPMDLITVSIRDTGKGIGKAYLENHLYRPFVQEDPLSDGTGLGLSIVKALVDKLHGSVEVQSKVNVGTRVEISAPVTGMPSIDGASAILPLPHALPHGQLSVCFVGLDNHSNHSKRASQQLSVSSQKMTALRSALVVHFEQWLDLKCTYAHTLEEASGSIIVLDEEYMSSRSSTSLRNVLPKDSILLLLCTQHSIHDGIRHPKRPRVHYLSQPFGPRQVAAVLNNLPLPEEEAGDVSPRTAATTEIPESLGFTDDKVPFNDVSEVLQVLPPTNPTVASDTGSASVSARVLLVDDNEINLALISRSVKKLNCWYATACNGAEAVEAYKASESRFDYVFMDISMPVMDGFAATRAIREFERTSGRTPAQIVAMTGLGSGEARREGLACGMDLYLTKPVQLKKVKSLIETGTVEASEPAMTRRQTSVY